MWLSSAAVTARALQSCRPTETLAAFLLSDIQTFFGPSWKCKSQVCPDRGAMCFPSQPSPALRFQVSALRQQAAHRWEEEEREKKKYRRLNINIIEGFWEAFLSHVDGIALLNGSQPLFLLLLSPSLFAFSPAPSLTVIRPTTSEQVLICREYWASEMLPLSSKVFFLWERSLEIWFAHWWFGGALEPLPCLGCL